MASTLLQRARIVQPDVTGIDGPPSDDAHPRDIRIADGVITEVGDLDGRPGEDVVDLAGWILLPAAVEPHAHLDKAFLAERVENPTGDLLGAIRAMESAHPHLTVADTTARAERAARLMARNGYSAVRTHVDVTAENGLRSVEALTQVRATLRDLIDIEIVALSGWPVVGTAGADQRALLRAAMQAGADLVGGCPHLEDAGTRAATDVLLGIAAGIGAGVDLHTDETLDANVDGLSDLCRSVLDGFDGPATASHCVSLGQRDERAQRETAELVASAGVGVVVLPHTNLFLQGRDRAPMPRGLTAVAALQAAGVVVAAGADNLQDPFNPLGRACPFETAGLMILAAHLLPGDAWAAVSAASRRVLGLEPVTFGPGSPADLLAVRAGSVREAIAWAPAERKVWRSGRLRDLPARETES